LWLKGAVSLLFFEGVYVNHFQIISNLVNFIGIPFELGNWSNPLW
jgi:hypothetical protein